LVLKLNIKTLDVRKDFDKLLLIVFSKDAINEDEFNLYFEIFTEIAEKYNGCYDDWETSIENHQQLN